MLVLMAAQLVPWPQVPLLWRVAPELRAHSQSPTTTWASSPHPAAMQLLRVELGPSWGLGTSPNLAEPGSPQLSMVVQPTGPTLHGPGHPSQAGKCSREGRHLPARGFGDGLRKEQSGNKARL